MSSFIEDACVNVKGRWAVQLDPRVKLEPWQRAMLDDIFELDERGFRRYREILIGVARKNGKSLLTSGLGHFLLSPLDGEFGPEVISAAGSRDQARFLHDVAKKQVVRSPVLNDMMRVTRNAILCAENEGSWTVVSAEAGLQQGANVHAGLIDEYHVHKSDEMYVALQMGSQAREMPLLVTISTAGADLVTPLGRLYEGMLESPEIEQPTPYLTIARNRAAGALMYWWAAPEDADLEDPAVINGCNPASWVTPEGITRVLNAPATRVEEARRYHYNQWVKVAGGAIPPQAWKDCKGPLRIPAGVPVYAGVDVAWVEDDSAVVIAAEVEGRIVIESQIWHPPGGEQQFEIEIVANHLRKIAEAYRVREFAFDPYGFQSDAQRLMSEGFRMVIFRQNNENMARACRTFYELVREGRISHAGSLDFDRHVLNAEVKDVGGGGWRFVKPKGSSEKKIDGLIAAAMAVDRLVNREQSPYGRRGLRTL